jgi:signal transduction histidine kinase
MPETGGKISIKGRKEEGDHLILEISDNGSGIKSEDLTKIFNPFFSNRPDGTGLGLAIVQRLVNEWNGSITVDSEPGRGSIFTLRLPQ